MPQSNEWVTPNKLAKELGVSAQAVLKAIENGRFSDDCLRKEKTKKGKRRFKLELKLAVKQWDQNRKGLNTTVTDEEYQQARRSEAISRAKIAELEVAEKEGQLVNILECQKYHAKLATNLVTGIENEIKRIAPSLINISTSKEVETILRKCLMGHFEEFSRGCEGKGPYSKRLR